MYDFDPQIHTFIIIVFPLPGIPVIHTYYGAVDSGLIKAQRKCIPVPGIVPASAYYGNRRFPRHSFKNAAGCSHHQFGARCACCNSRCITFSHIVHRQDIYHFFTLAY